MMNVLEKSVRTGEEGDQGWGGRRGAWEDQGRPAGVPGDKRYPGVGGDTEDRVAVRAVVLR